MIQFCIYIFTLFTSFKLVNTVEKSTFCQNNSSQMAVRQMNEKMASFKAVRA